MCIRGGWLPQTTPIPETDVRVLDAGPLGEITFVHVNMQKKWLLKVCAKGKPTPGALKASKVWQDVKDTLAKQGCAAVADEESDEEGDGEDDPMVALVSASGATKRQAATPTSAKKQRTGGGSSNQVWKTGLARGEAADRHAAAVHCVQMPARSQLKFPDDKGVRNVRVASFKRRTLWLDAKDLEWLITTIMDDVSLGGVPNITDGDKDEAAVADKERALGTSTPQKTSGAASESPVAQGSGAGYTAAWNFKGAWVATITRECANRGKTIEMEVKKLTRKKWDTARAAKGYDYEWVGITDEQRKQAALDYLDIVVPSLLH